MAHQGYVPIEAAIEQLPDVDPSVPTAQEDFHEPVMPEPILDHNTQIYPHSISFDNKVKIKVVMGCRS